MSQNKECPQYTENVLKVIKRKNLRKRGQKLENLMKKNANKHSAVCTTSHKYAK